MLNIQCPIRSKTSNGGNYAFTLIELSIVMVIIGLLIGGILVGQSLIKQAKLNSIIKEVNSIKYAINLFSMKYNQMPGDMTNASSFLIDPNGNTINNGDGDGTICSATASCNFISTNSAFPKMQEVYSAFQELTIIGALNGYYNGIIGATRSNLPFSSYENGLYWIGADTFWSNYPQLHRIMLTNTTVTNGLVDYVVTSKDALLIDQKIDDGYPLDGNVYGLRGDSGCNSYGPPFNYRLAATKATYLNNNDLCDMIFNIN